MNCFHFPFPHRYWQSKYPEAGSNRRLFLRLWLSHFRQGLCTMHNLTWRPWFQKWLSRVHIQVIDALHLIIKLAIVLCMPGRVTQNIHESVSWKYRFEYSWERSWFSLQCEWYGEMWDISRRDQRQAQHWLLQCKKMEDQSLQAPQKATELIRPWLCLH